MNIHKHVLVIGANGTGKSTHGRALAGTMNRPHADMSRILKIAAAFTPETANRIMPYGAATQGCANGS